MKWIAGGVAALIAAGIGGYFVEEAIAQSNAIDRLVLCQKIQGMSDASPEKVKALLDNLEKSPQGMNWREGIKIIGTFSGCPDVAGP